MPVDFIVEMLRNGGLPVMMFVIFILYHRGENAKWAETTKAQKEESQRIYELLKSTLDRQEKETDRHFTLLREMAEAMNLQTRSLSRIETKIDDNQFCPITKKEKAA